MLPSLTHVREIARRVVCASNERQIGLAINMFADGHGGRIPASVFLDPSRVGGATVDVTMIVKGEDRWVEQLKRYELREPDPSENGVTAKRQREEAAAHG